MKTFKSLIASAAMAASTLGFVVVSAPAHAGINWNGPVLNGISLQGIQFNGVRLNGIKVNGIRWNGISLNGPLLQGPLLQGSQTPSAQTGRIVAVSLPGGEVVRLAP